MDVNGAFGSCSLAGWWSVQRKQATSSSWVAEFLLFCLSPVGEKSVLVNFRFPLAICGIGYKFHQSYTNHNSIWFESRALAFSEKNQQGKCRSGKNRPYIPLLTELPEVSWLAGCQHSAVLTSKVNWLRWTSSRDEAFMTWKSCKKRMLRIYMILLCTQHKLRNLLFPCSIFF